MNLPMTLPEKLQNHSGRLLRIKSKLFWYKDSGYFDGWDGNSNRICLVLDAKPATSADIDEVAAIAEHATQQTSPITSSLLFIDGSPRWIWLNEKDVELLADERT